MKVIVNTYLPTWAAFGVLALAILAPAPAWAASLKLFDATPLTASGPKTDPSKAVPFGIAEVEVFCGALGRSASIASTADGKGNLVVDNFFLVNDTNVCTGPEEFGRLGTSAPDCFLASYGAASRDATIAYQPVAPIDISDQLTPGRQTLRFEMSDWGGSLANSEVWLVTSCVIERVALPYSLKS